MKGSPIKEMVGGGWKGGSNSCIVSFKVFLIWLLSPHPVYNSILLFSNRAGQIINKRCTSAPLILLTSKARQCALLAYGFPPFDTKVDLYHSFIPSQIFSSQHSFLNFISSLHSLTCFSSRP